MLHIKFPIFQRGALFCMATTLFLGGCAVNVNPPSASLTPPPTTRESVLINYSDGQIQSRLVELDLLKPFNDYWSAHAARDWARLHAFEVAEAPISATFYVPYHARAWQVTHVDVLSLEQSDAEARMTLSMKFRDPDSGKVRAIHRQDKWVRMDGVWRHWVTDPMLTGNR